jgi:hypothetical protein
MRRPALLLALLLASRVGCATSYDQLSLEVWCELEPMFQESDAYPLSTEQARRRILEEARGILSDMIYGLEFSYTPGDERRKTAEQFVLARVGEIRWADPRLRVVQAELREGRLYAKVLYDLQDFQSARRKAWESNSIPAATGSGSFSLFTGPAPEGKRRSLEEALKDALRNHLRPIVFNKPREVRGELLVWQEPQVVIASGAYLTRVTIKLKVKEVRAYSLF